MSPGILDGAWWEARPRGLVADGIRKATQELYVGEEAPPGMEEYQLDPIAFMVEELGIRRETLVWSENPGYENHKWDGTPDPIATWFRALANRENVGIESATGTGKSFGLALTKLWFLASWQGSRCFDFAAKKEQLEEYSWVELRKLFPRFKVLFPSADIHGLRIRMDGKVREGELAGWGAVGMGVKVGADDEIATGAAGIHAPHLLLSHEETQGIDHAVLNATENTATGPHNLRQAVGNPDAMDDALHQFCISDDVHHIIISALDHPNVVVNEARDPEWRDLDNDVQVVPGAVSRISVARRRRKLGPDNPMYRSRVRGISPPQHKDALYRQEWIERAVERWHTEELLRGLPALACDVARSDDGDYASIAEGTGAHLEYVRKFRCNDVSALGVRLAVLIRMREILERHVGVDVGGGYGGGTVDKLKELGIYVQAINPGAGAVSEVDQTLLDEKQIAVRHEVEFRNFRAQTHWRLAMDLQLGRIALPPDEELHQDLRAVRWEPKNGKVWIEEKDEIKKRLGRSPDKGDAVVMWNWVRNRRHEEEEEQLSAWDPKALEYERTEGRRVRSKPPVRKDKLNPTLMERIE